MFNWLQKTRNSGDKPTATCASASPSSPVMDSRVDERNALADLNERLAAYIERVHKLDSENTVLRRTVKQWQSSSLREAKGITKLHGTELSRARKLIDKLARETATLQFENAKLKSDCEDSKKRVQVGDKQLADTSSGL